MINCEKYIFTLSAESGQGYFTPSFSTTHNFCSKLSTYNVNRSTLFNSKLLLRYLAQSWYKMFVFQYITEMYSAQWLCETQKVLFKSVLIIYFSHIHRSIPENNICTVSFLKIELNPSTAKNLHKIHAYLTYRITTIVYMWCDQVKWVWSQKNSFLVF